MAYYKNYIGYNSLYNTNKLGFIPIPILVKGALTILPKLAPFILNAFKHPAKDANNLIDSIKPELAKSDARGRLALVLATAEKIGNNARDVRAEKLLLWYKNNYRNDYKSLSFEDKSYYNQILANKMQTEADGNGFYQNSQMAMFNNNELNYNATPIEQGTNVANKLVDNLSKNSSSLLLYGGIGLGLLLMLKNK